MSAALATLELTALGWLFVPLGLLLLLWRPVALFWLAGLSVVLQAPAVMLFSVPAGAFGLTPFNAACGFLALHLLLRLRRERAALWRAAPGREAFAWWSAFFALTAIGAMLLPRLFDGVQVHPALVRGVTLMAPEPNHWSVSHLAQAVNAAALWVLFAAAWLARWPGRALRNLLAGLGSGFVLALAAGVQQRLAAAGWLPMWREFWASNPGYNQWFHAPEYGPQVLLRVGLPFIEPSYAGVFFAAVTGGAAAVALYGRRGRRVAALVAVLAGLGLVNTLGTSGAFALAAFGLGLLLFHAVHGRRLVAPRVTRALGFATALGGLLAAVVLWDWRVGHSGALAPLREAFDWTWAKVLAYADSERAATNRQAWLILRDTWGLGAGAGSTRASSWFLSLLANTGLPGVLLFLGALAVSLRAALPALRRGSTAAIALCGALATCLLGVASGIPDQGWPVLWGLLAGLFLLAVREGTAAGRGAAARPLRILLLTQWFDPEPTFKGIAFARALREQGHQVEVLTGVPNYPGGRIYPGYRLRPYAREVVDGVVLHRVPLYPSHDRSARGRVLNYLSFAASSCLFGLFAARRPDVLYCYQPPLTTVLSGLAIGRLRGVPVVVDIQDLWPDTLRATGMVRSDALLRAVGAVCRLAYRWADALVVLSPGFRQALLERGVPPAKVQVIYNWCDERSLAAEASPPPPAAMAGRFNVAFAGTMGKAQALDAVIEAAALVAPRAPQVQFVFVGGGIELDHLKALAAERAPRNVVFLPRMPMAEVGSVLHGADALLVHLKDDPLFAITVPSKTQAYMAVGRPVIMAVRGDAARLVEQSGGGVTAAPEQPGALADAVLRLAAMAPQERAAIGARAAGYYREHMSLQAGVRQFEALFRRCADPDLAHPP